MLCLMSPETMVPEGHPIRAIKKLADEALAKLSSAFDEMYAATGRPSIPPEHLLKAQLLIALYTVRSERQFCEQLGYNLLFRWFLDMDMVAPTFDATVFTKIRHCWRRQGVRHAGLRRGLPRYECRAARRAEHHRTSRLRDRCANHTPPRLCRQPARPKEGRGDLRLVQDRRHVSSYEVPRPRPNAALRVLHRRRLQPLTNDEATSRPDLTQPPAPAPAPTPERQRNSPAGGHATWKDSRLAAAC